jgi:hypothetical protein
MRYLNLLHPVLLIRANDLCFGARRSPLRFPDRTVLDSLPMETLTKRAWRATGQSQRVGNWNALAASTARASKAERWANGRQRRPRAQTFEGLGEAVEARCRRQHAEILEQPGASGPA